LGAGDIQWMTAGSGIMHHEMPKGDFAGRMHGFQLWANLLRFTAAFSDGKELYAIRYATDRKAPTLYASPVGAGYCLVSEPLNDDVDAWAE
ncbi:pirin family protein, partial [Rhizobium johnstonii]|uniref:pirin family protein n=1 Tax=Rhizobium johnstonii TaxID=3019933 RepID=UPI003F95E9FD